MIVLGGTTLGEVWLELLAIIMENGETVHDDGQVLYEARNVYASLSSVDPEDPVITRFADKGRIELMRKKYTTCGLVGNYKIDYGSYIYNNNGVNQVEWVIDRIKGKPETKSATIGLHVAGENMLSCLSLMDFKLRGGVLGMNAVYRSQNAFASLPGNLLALRSIQEHVAVSLGAKLGAIDLAVFSSHVYERDFNRVRDVLRAAKAE